MESSHDKEHISAIDVGWATTDAAYETAQSTVDYQDTQFRRFQDYYNKRLKALYDNENRGTEHQAHYVLAFETRMKRMKAKLDRTSDNAEQLNESQEELASAYNISERTNTISR